MASVGSLTVDLALESANFISNMAKAAESSERTAKSIESAMELAKGAVEGFIGAWSVDRIAETIDQAIEFGAHVQDLANKTGASTNSIQEFTFAMRAQGASSEDADGALQKFSKSLGAAQNGNGIMAKLLMSLGVTSFTSYDQALSQAMEGLGKLPSQTQRASDATTLFGKSAYATAAIASQGADGYKELAEEAEKYGVVLDGDVIKNSKEAEEKINTLKEVLSADISGAILKNADAIGSFADELIKLVGAIPNALQHLENLKTQFAMDHPQLSGGDSVLDQIEAFLPGGGGLAGLHAKVQSWQDTQRNTMMGNHDGRQMLFNTATAAYNKAKASGDQAGMASAAATERSIAAAEHRAQQSGEGGTVPITNDAHLPAKKAKKGPTLKTDAELQAQWQEQYDQATKNQMEANLALLTDPDDRYQAQKSIADVDYNKSVAKVDADTGTDQQVREGKKKLTQAQADQLKQIMAATESLKDQKLLNDKDAEVANERLDLALSGKKNEADLLQSQMALATSSKERSDLAVQLVDNQYDQEKLALQNTVYLASIGEATKEQADAAKARLAALPALQKNAVAGARKQNEGALQQWMDQIPKTAGEMNDALQKVEVDGLDGLTDGLTGVIDGTKSVGEAFSDMSKTIIDDLVKIGLQALIVEPIAKALFGGLGGGGLFGGLFGGGSSFDPTKLDMSGVGQGLDFRANGGLTSPGLYMVGERGPELVNIGSNANVTTARQLQGVANDNQGANITFAAGSITSNDPPMVQQMVYQGIAQAMPINSQQAKNTTIKQLQRRQM